MTIPMRTTRTRTAVAGLLASALALGACGGIDREGSIDQLVETGLTRDQATCVLDASIDEFGEDRVTSDDDLTPEEEAAMTDIVVECMAS